MEIVVGSARQTTPIRAQNQEMAGSGFVEAKVLTVRPTRKRRGMPPVGDRDRRQSGDDYDPAAGRVLMLMIPDGTMIPRDIDSGNYRVFVRFASK
jgi:hypothetical protein